MAHIRRASLVFSQTIVIPSGKVQLENQPVPGGGTVPEAKEDPRIQPLQDDWENDPANARNWPLGKRWTGVFIISLYSFLSPLGSSMMSPGLPQVATKYGITSETILALSLSIYLLSFAISLILFAPLSEMYGRTWIFHISTLLFAGCNFGCAFAPNAGSLIGLRFLAGLAGGGPIACGPGSISDLFSEHDRALPMSVYTLGALLGPVIGPIAGGYIAQTLGIKYVFLVIAAFALLATTVGIILLRETYAPVIRCRRTTRSFDSENLPGLPFVNQAQENKLQYIWINLRRPVTLLFRSFVCFSLSLYMSFVYGVYYLMFTTFPEVLSSTYGFSPGNEGLAYLGLGLGFIMATSFSAKCGSKIYQHLADKNGGKGKPEMHMPVLLFGSLFAPIGLFWYGWSVQAKLHWSMPIIGSGIFGFGMMTSCLPILLYVVEAFMFAASASAAASVFRSLLGFVFPLFGQQMFNALGTGGGNSLLAGLAIVLGIPFPIWLYYKGEALRLNSKM